MTLNILGYVLGIGFVLFGISALVIYGSEIYKVISKSKKKGDYKKSVYFGIMAIICVLVLIIIVNVF
ncbi:hypothetical protein [Staphylococcus sp. EZ-P03]|uniref:hypothetical protein n=1 Tax=Staphylococcus sp. EZ-P03 TaxID=2282739 RepID=UPI000DF767EB|nr:hypothetical protein [Staphylococcus sp. EZ-P03]